MISEADRWDHNIHYHRLILDSVPAECGEALHVDCGEGMLAPRLPSVVPHVGIGLDQPNPRPGQRPVAG